MSLTPEEKNIAFQREAVPHMNALYSFGLNLTANAEEAADLLQETYMKAYRFFESFKVGTNCKAWLFQIMKNTFINRYRKISREPDKVSYDDIEEFFETIKSTDVSLTTLDKEVFGASFDDEVQRALKTLPEVFRTVVMLCDLEDFTYEEIAEIVDCPIGTVRSRLHRTRKLLYEKLYDYAKEHGYVPKEDTDTTPV